MRKVLPKNHIQYKTSSESPVSSREWEPSDAPAESSALDTPAKPAPSDAPAAPSDSDTLAKPAPSDTSGSDAPPSLSFDSLAQIGINIEMGLDYCGGEEDFYLEMLEMFCSQAEEKKAEIISLYDAAVWADYAIKVHALKSTSLTIGAEKLSEQAKALELAGKKADEAYIRQNHPLLLSLYDKVCEHIAGLQETS